MSRPVPKTLRGCRCQCTSCLDYFGSPSAFDKHRKGAYAGPGSFQHSRYCLTESEMLAAGWCRNEQGFLLAPDPRRVTWEAAA